MHSDAYVSFRDAMAFGMIPAFVVSIINNPFSTALFHSFLSWFYLAFKVLQFAL